MDKKARIISGWVGDGLTRETAFVPAVVVEHGLTTWTDTSGGQPGPKGAVQIEALVDQKKIDQIKADPKYDGKVAELLDPIAPTPLPVGN